MTRTLAFCAFLFALSASAWAKPIGIAIDFSANSALMIGEDGGSVFNFEDQSGTPLLSPANVHAGDAVAKNVHDDGVDDVRLASTGPTDPAGAQAADPVPEPTTVLLFAGGLAMLLLATGRAPKS